jgi:hypothetical protein
LERNLSSKTSLAEANRPDWERVATADAATDREQRNVEPEGKSIHVQSESATT